ncbi:hypothetical protein [Maribacter antarcticus]|uniref:hypothetical protein n=1 Tax=Maribacter antarcticus TaxID=505250 RepID=UPI00047DDD42|nr:hypothetical protein [Maribacter antarcticus]
MKNILFIVFVLVGYTGIGQVGLNEYKYIIIPKTLGEFKEENQYLTSTLLKYQFVKKGFTAVYDDALPEDLYMNRCLGLTALLKDKPSMFSTKTTIVLENCKGQQVFRSREGTNKIKEYEEAYKDGITVAMSSFDGLNYSYKQKVVENKPITLRFKNDIKSLGGDNKEQKETADLTGIGVGNRSEVVKQKSSLENQSYKSMEPVASDMKQATPNPDIKTKTSAGTGKEMLNAKAIPNGYQLIDSELKVIMKLLNSSTENVFIGQAEGKSGMVFQKNGIWIFEYYSGANLTQEELNIKF